ncbi:MAG: hypothetical protein ACREX9_17825 [Gammaproteobacteria bacterium]
MHEDNLPMRAVFSGGIDEQEIVEARLHVVVQNSAVQPRRG